MDIFLGTFAVGKAVLGASAALGSLLCSQVRVEQMISDWLLCSGLCGTNEVLAVSFGLVQVLHISS